jgi:hypothetical protein
LTRRVLGGVASLTIGGVFVVASGLAAIADSPDVVTPSTQASVQQNPDGSVDVTVAGTWDWSTHGNKDCNVDRYAAGWAVVWNDPKQPGNFVGSLNGVNYAVGTPTDNTVHYMTSPRCGVLNPAIGHPTGTWGPDTHHYASVADVPKSVCAVTYDIHNGGKNGAAAPKDGDLVAGGNGAAAP